MTKLWPALNALLATSVILFVDGTVHNIHKGQSIQDALDDATDGDVIRIQPGTYYGPPNSLYGLRISKNHIRLVAAGKPGSVRLLHTGTQETGVYAAPPGCEYTDTECGETLKGFSIQGISVEGFPANGIQTRWVDGFRFLNSQSVNNLENGLYMTLSSNGVVNRCTSSGSRDSGLWVAGSQNVRVKNTEIYNSTTGFEVTVSNNVYASHNTMHDNVVGIGLYHPNMAGTDPDFSAFDNWIFKNNRVYDNNLVNDSPAGSFQSFLPSGIGILMVGVSGHTIRKNDIQRHDSVSVGLLAAGYCTVVQAVFGSDCVVQPPKNGDPSLNNNTYTMNRFADNGGNPDGPLARPFPPGQPLDIVYAQSPEEILPNEQDLNCFKDNTNGGSDAISLSVGLPFSTAGCD